MASLSPRWFYEEIYSGTIIALDQPVPPQWKILEKLNEHDFQTSEGACDRDGSHSFATTKLLCCDPKKPTKKAFMRVYLQVHYQNTEMQDPKTRSRHATTFTPPSPELRAYQKFTRTEFRNTRKLLESKIGTQDKSGPVPQGFAIWLAWEMVPGLRLGDKSRDRDDPYWRLPASEREQVRTVFMNVLPTAMGKGYLPDAPSLYSLVWHKQTKTLYFIGYFFGIDLEPQGRGIQRSVKSV